MARLLSMPPGLIERLWYFSVEDDFTGGYVSADRWTALAADAGVTAPNETDALGGVLSMATGATDNNEVAIFTTAEMFLFSADRPLYACCLLQFTEANTDDANVAFGFANAAGADLLSDDGAGDNINSSGVLIYKVDGGTVWRCASENNSVVNDTASIQTAGGADYQFLEIFGFSNDGTNYEFVYKLDGMYLTDSNNIPIYHRLAFASATEMDFGVYLKAGGANSETLLVDFIGAYQLRAARLPF